MKTNPERASAWQAPGLRDVTSYSVVSSIGDAETRLISNDHKRHLSRFKFVCITVSK